MRRLQVQYNTLKTQSLAPSAFEGLYCYTHHHSAPMHDQTQAKPSSFIPAVLLTSAACCSALASQTDGTNDALNFKSCVAELANDGVLDLSRAGGLFTATSLFLAMAHSDWTGGIPSYFVNSLKWIVSYSPLAQFLSFLTGGILATEIFVSIGTIGTLRDWTKTGTR